MRSIDLLRLAFANLRRNRTRSMLTLLGVTIGVASLLALLSYGAGLQQSARGEFNALELYNTLRVTSRPNPFNSFGDLAVRQRLAEEDSLAEVPITDSLLAAFAEVDGVLAAYPEVVFPVEVREGDRAVVANAEAVPLVFGTIASYQPTVGRFFEEGVEAGMLVAPSMARRLGFEAPEALVGDSLTLVTATLDLGALQASMRAFQFGLGALPLQEEEHRLEVVGLLDEDSQPLSGLFRVVLPLEQARTMQKITFFSTIDLLLRRGSSAGYAAARVQLADADAYAPVKRALEETGVFVTGLREQFGQLERLFLVMDLALAIVGFIALLVATLGIANTMMMSVLERRREIGVMKAVGGDEGDLQRLFVAESLMLGLVGGALGLLAGWGLTALIEAGVGAWLAARDLPRLEIFYATPLMVLGILGVAVLVALIAGLAPARRAARVEPIEALRSA